MATVTAPPTPPDHVGLAMAALNPTHTIYDEDRLSMVRSWHWYGRGSHLVVVLLNAWKCSFSVDGDAWVTRRGSPEKMTVWLSGVVRGWKLNFAPDETDTAAVKFCPTHHHELSPDLLCMACEEEAAVIS